MVVKTSLNAFRLFLSLVISKAPMLIGGASGNLMYSFVLVGLRIIVSRLLLLPKT